MTSLTSIIQATLLMIVLALEAQATEPMPRAIRFTNVTESVNLNAGGGRAAWGDLDGDGWSDLVVGGRIWRNMAGLRFEDVTATAGIGRHGGACVIADFNGDGTNDLYMLGRKGALYLGRTKETLADCFATSATGVFKMSLRAV